MTPQDGIVQSALNVCRGPNRLRKVFQSEFRRRGSHKNEVCIDESTPSSLYVDRLAEHVNNKFCKS